MFSKNSKVKLAKFPLVHLQANTLASLASVPLHFNTLMMGKLWEIYREYFDLKTHYTLIQQTLIICSNRVTKGTLVSLPSKSSHKF